MAIGPPTADLEPATIVGHSLGGGVSAGHFPHLDEPARFTATLEDWIASTEPARPDDARFRAAIRGNAA
jgi:hypothetical protein